jgi:hypothetical protein
MISFALFKASKVKSLFGKPIGVIPNMTNGFVIPNPVNRHKGQERLAKNNTDYLHKKTFMFWDGLESFVGL